MTFLPFEKFEIESSFTREEMIQVLKENIAPEKFRLKKNNTKPFKGRVVGNELIIQRIIGYRSFLPVIKIRMKDIENRAVLIVNIKGDGFMIAARLIMYSFFGYFFLFHPLQEGRIFTDHEGPILSAVLLLLWVYIETMGVYLFEAAKAKNILLRISQGRIARHER
jgi:hypothetical protein